MNSTACHYFPNLFYFDVSTSFFMFCTQHGNFNIKIGIIFFSGDEGIEDCVEPSSIYKDSDSSPRMSPNSPSSSFSSKSAPPSKSDLNSPSPSASTPSSKKSSKPSRMVSLGAAAQYAKESQTNKEVICLLLRLYN